MGFEEKAWKDSLMFTPPHDRTRMLDTVRAEPRAAGTLQFLDGYVTRLAKYYPRVTENQVRELLGDDASGPRRLTAEQIDEFLAGLEKLDRLGRGKPMDS
jgi:hypothetical protein